MPDAFWKLIQLQSSNIKVDLSLLTVIRLGARIAADQRERERSALTNTKPLVFSSVTLTSTKEKKITVIVCSE